MVALLCFWFRIIASKMLFLQVCLPLKVSLVTTLSETRAFTSRNSVVKKGLKVAKSSRKYKYFGSAASLCFRKLALKMLIFEILFLLEEPLVVTFRKTRALASKKYVLVQGMDLPKSYEKYKLLWLYSSVFALEW